MKRERRHIIENDEEEKRWRISDRYCVKLPKFQPMTPSRRFEEAEKVKKR